jgi:prepilin-type N-terminal cleavage/methylation domain-containing protein
MIKRNKGFTLIELLVVIAIIGILSSVVLASLNSARKKSRDARRISDLKQIQLALEMYADANGSAYPASIASLVTTYMPSTPADPMGADYSNGGAYFYQLCTDTTRYNLGTDLEESTNPALTTDAETPGCAVASPFTASADTAGCAGTANRYCYNVSP